MEIKCFDDLVSVAKQRKTTVAIVNAQELHTAGAIVKAKSQGIAEGILIGDGEKIKEAISHHGGNPADFEIIHTDTNSKALETAVAAIKSGRAKVMMKGDIETGEFLKAIISRENGLRGRGLLSAIGLFETPAYHKIFAITDFAMNLAPDIDGKVAIIKSSVALLNKLGIENPKVAIMAETERLNPKVPASVEAAEIKKLWQEGEIKNCILEGPIAFDLATSREAAEIKSYDSPVAGDADLLIVPEIVSGNMLVKAITGFGGAITAGIVLGAAIPVIMTSRSATKKDKFYSIALASASA